MENSRLNDFLKLTYPVTVSRQEDGAWRAEIKLLRGCVAVHPVREEALRLVDEAKRTWLDDALRNGMDIPKPRLICE